MPDPIVPAGGSRPDRLRLFRPLFGRVQHVQITVAAPARSLLFRQTMDSFPVPSSRACRACSQLKVRCLPSPTDAETCQRCQAGGRECIPGGKRRRPRERIAELEAQVALLTKALNAQRVSPQQPQVAAADAQSTSQHVAQNPSGPKAVLALLDAHVSAEAQQKALETYIRHLSPILPAFPLLRSDLTELRKEAPLLLLSVVAFATSYLLSANSRHELSSGAMRIFAFELISKPTRRIEVVWAILVTASWFRARPGTSHVTIHQLIQLATGMAVDIGLGGPQISVVPGGEDGEAWLPSSLDGQRAWLACFVNASFFSIGLRRNDSYAQWTPHHDTCLANLSFLQSMGQKNTLFLQIVRAHHILHRIATSLVLCDPTRLWDMTSDDYQRIVSDVTAEIDDWTAGIATDVEHRPLLLLYRHGALILLNEPVLHTSTNKATFGTPFPLRGGKMGEDDFAKPTVTGKHVAALYALRDSCHAVLDLALEPGTTAFLATCPLLYIAQVLVALFILHKLYVSTTAPGNTYGTILTPSQLRVEQYHEQLRTLTNSVQDLNPDSYNARMLACHLQLKEWLKGYTARINPSQAARPILPGSAGETTASERREAPKVEGEQPSSETAIGEDQWPLLDEYQSWMNDWISGDLLM